MRKSKILIATFDKQLVFELCSNLKDMGIDVFHTYDAVETFENLQEQDIDLLIIDYSTPFVDSYSILKKIRHNYPEIPMILLVTKDEMDSLKDYLPMYRPIEAMLKPISVITIIEATQRHIGRDRRLKKITKSREFDKNITTLNLEPKEHKEHLKEWDERAIEVFNEIPDNIMVIQRGRIVFANVAAMGWLGYDKDTLFNSHITSLLLPEDRRRARSMLRAWMERRAPSLFTFSIRSSENEVLKAEARVTKIL